uniref:DASH complex subunit DAM1 n=1 Tax=Elaeophora elaphi TaxID=1147741 RepID=A0A0R3RG69_9BILA
MDGNFYDRWADNDYEQNVETQESSKLQMSRYYGLTEVDSSLQDAIVRMNCVQNMLNKITLANKSEEFCQLLQDFSYNVEEMRLKFEAMLSPYANLEQFSTDLATDSDQSTGISYVMFCAQSILI